MGGSALSKLNNVYGIRLADWSLVEKDSEKAIWKNKRTSEELEQYKFVVNDTSEFRAEQDVFQIRYRSQCLVSSKYLQVQEKTDICSTIVRGSIFVERIPIRLIDINEIPFPDALHFYSQCFKGFSQLWMRFKYFDITEQLIGCNHSGKVKVWMNSTFDAVFPEINYLKPQGTETQMLQKLLQLLDLNTDQSQQSQQFYIYLNSTKPKTFLDGLFAIESYSRMHRIQIPSCSLSVISMFELTKSNFTLKTFHNNTTSQVSKSRVQQKIQETISSKPLNSQPPEFSFKTTTLTNRVLSPSILSPLNQNLNKIPFVPLYSSSRDKSYENKKILPIRSSSKFIPMSPYSHKQSLTPKIVYTQNTTPEKSMRSITNLNKTPAIDKPHESICARISSFSPQHNINQRSSLAKRSSQAYGIKQSYNYTFAQRISQNNRKIMPSKQYYSMSSDGSFQGDRKYTSNSVLINRLAGSKPQQVLYESSPIPTSVEKKQSTSIKLVAAQRENRFHFSNDSTNSKPYNLDSPKNHIVFVNPKQNSSTQVYSEKQLKNNNKYSRNQQERPQQRPFTPSSQYYQLNKFNGTHIETPKLYTNHKEEEQPQFPTPYIINLKPKQEPRIFHIEPRGSVYVKQKQTSVSSIRISKTDYNYQQVKVSNQIHGVIKQERKRLNLLGVESYSINKFSQFQSISESPVEYRIDLDENRFRSPFVTQQQPTPNQIHQQYEHHQRQMDAQFQREELQSDVYNQIASQKMGIPRHYLQSMDSDVQEDFINMKIRINNQLMDPNL